MIIPTLPTAPPRANIEASSVYPGYLMPVGAEYQYKPLGFFDISAWSVFGFICRGIGGYYVGRQISRDPNAALFCSVGTATAGLFGPALTAVFFGVNKDSNQALAKESWGNIKRMKKDYL